MTALLRLVNGSDVVVKVSVADAIAALDISRQALEFVELPGENGPIHIRPTHVIAVLDHVDHKTTGFRSGR